MCTMRPRAKWKLKQVFLSFLSGNLPHFVPCSQTGFHCVFCFFCVFFYSAGMYGLYLFLIGVALMFANLFQHGASTLVGERLTLRLRLNSFKVGDRYFL